MIIASYLHYSDLESISKVCQVFDQIFNQKFTAYKTFYDSLTWNRCDWNSTVDDFFDLVIKCLFEELPYQKVYRLKLLRSRFSHSLTPQNIFRHLCFCYKARNSVRHPNNCVLCCPVPFFDSELYYYEHFHVGLTKIEVRAAKNLYQNNMFNIFGKTPNWFRTLNSPSIVYFTNTSQLLNEFGCTTMKIFLNVFLSDQFFYTDFPLHQFLNFRKSLFTYSKKFLVSISAYLNRKFLRFFFDFSCPHSDYNYDNLKILNEVYYDYVKKEKEFNRENGLISRIQFKKTYYQSILNSATLLKYYKK